MVADHLGPGSQRIADAGRGEVAHFAADMDPRAEHGVAAERIVAQPQHGAGVDQSLLGVDRGGFAHVMQVLPHEVRCAGDVARGDPSAHRQRGLAGRRAMVGHHWVGPVGKAWRRFGRRQASLPHSAIVALAGDRQANTAFDDRGFDLGDFAVIDRLAEAALRGPVLQPGAAPFRHRLVGHIGIDIHPRHQPAGKAEARRHGVVVDLVLRRLGGVEGMHEIGGDHGGSPARVLTMILARGPAMAKPRQTPPPLTLPGTTGTAADGLASAAAFAASGAGSATKMRSSRLSSILRK